MREERLSSLAMLLINGEFNTNPHLNMSIHENSIRDISKLNERQLIVVLIRITHFNLNFFEYSIYYIAFLQVMPPPPTPRPPKNETYSPEDIQLFTSFQRPKTFVGQAKKVGALYYYCLFFF